MQDEEIRRLEALRLAMQKNQCQDNNADADKIVADATTFDDFLKGGS